MLLKVFFIAHRLDEGIVHFRGALVAFFRRFPAGFDDDLVDRMRNARDDFARLGEMLLDLLKRDFGWGLAIERNLAGQNLKEDDPHRIDVALDAGGCPGQDFGGAIIDGPLDRVIVGLRSPDGGCNSEVGDFEGAIGHIEKIIGFDVPVDDAVLMDVIDA